MTELEIRQGLAARTLTYVDKAHLAKLVADGRQYMDLAGNMERDKTQLTARVAELEARLEKAEKSTVFPPDIEAITRDQAMEMMLIANKERSHFFSKCEELKADNTKLRTALQEIDGRSPLAVAPVLGNYVHPCEYHADLANFECSVIARLALSSEAVASEEWKAK